MGLVEEFTFDEDLFYGPDQQGYGCVFVGFSIPPADHLQHELRRVDAQ